MPRPDHLGNLGTVDLERRHVGEPRCGRVGDRDAGDADRRGGDGDDQELAEEGLAEARQPEARGDAAQRALAAAGLALDRRAVAARACVGTQEAPLRVAQVLLLDQGAGGVTAEHVLELLAHSPAGAEDQRLDRRLAHLERGRDLAVGAAFELAQDERLPLLRRQLGERGAERLGAAAFRLLDRNLLELDLDGAPRAVREGAAAFVVGDLDQPVARLLHALAASEGAEGADEGRLDDILRVRAGAQDQHDVPQNLVRVAPIQPVDLGRGVFAPETEDPGVTCDDDHCLG